MAGYVTAAAATTSRWSAAIRHHPGTGDCVVMATSGRRAPARLLAPSTARDEVGGWVGVWAWHAHAGATVRGIAATAEFSGVAVGG